MVFGGPVQGGKICGQFPDLHGSSELESGPSGRMKPTTSVDKYFEEMAKWFGVTSNNDLQTILPNLGNFSTDPDIGFIDPTVT